jgi:hypothetical protein
MTWLLAGKLILSVAAFYVPGALAYVAHRLSTRDHALTIYLGFWACAALGFACLAMHLMWGA